MHCADKSPCRYRGTHRRQGVVRAAYNLKPARCRHTLGPPHVASQAKTSTTCPDVRISFRCIRLKNALFQPRNTHSQTVRSSAKTAAETRREPDKQLRQQDKPRDHDQGMFSRSLTCKTRRRDQGGGASGAIFWSYLGAYLRDVLREAAAVRRGANRRASVLQTTQPKAKIEKSILKYRQDGNYER
jgi:hypothetical protein